MDKLSKQHESFFDLFKEPPVGPKKHPRANFVYYMGIDAEWYEELGRNVVLSYQIATLSNSTYKNIIKFVPKGKRLRLAELVEHGIRSVNGGELPFSHDMDSVRVVLISHNLAAEWSVLADRDEPHITKRLALVRRSPITDIHPIKILLDKRILVRVDLCDSMLLAPASHQSLKKLSGLLGKDDHKITITQHQIENMHLFLRDEPKKYREYALKDSEACLRLFLLLQDGLNKLVFGMRKNNIGEYQLRDGYKPQKLFRTLASAGVKSFEEHLRRSKPLSAEKFRFRSRLLINADKPPLYLESAEKFRFNSQPLVKADEPPLLLKFMPVPKPEENKLFMQRYGDFQGYQKALRESSCGNHLELVKRSYLGGRNESYFVGDTEKYDLSSNRLWIDIDFNSCYPAAMALYPAIDTKKRVRYTTPRYRIDNKIAKQMEQENIPKPKIDKARAALAESVEEFFSYLSSRKGQRHASAILELSQLSDNRLLNRWRKIASGTLKIVDAPPESFLIPGFAKVRFHFPDETKFPCLPVKHIQFGLIYPLKGETVVTAPEILLAMEAGAKIDALYSVEFPIMTDEGNVPVKLFAPHLSTIVQERIRQKAIIKAEKSTDEERSTASIMEKLLKEFANGLYGKTAQAINDRTVFRPSKRTMVPLGPSSITEPIVASLATGLSRAALSASLVAVERYNRNRPQQEQLVTISATTDGMLIGAPKPVDLQTAGEYYETNKEGNLELRKGVDESLADLLARCDCASLLDEMESFLPIRQMRQGRKILTGSDRNDPGVFLEVKHLVDRVVSVKTRGQIGLLNDQSIPLLAKFGHKPPLSDEIPNPEEYKSVMDAGGTRRNKADGDWLLKEMEEVEQGNGDIPFYNFFTLTSFRSMIDSDGSEDMTGKQSERKLNTDYDWKRKLPLDSPETLPYPTVRDMKVYRNQMEGVRRSGKVARTDMVHQRVAIKGRKTRFTGGDLTTITRLFLRGVLQGHIPLSEQRPSYAKIAEGLNRIREEFGFNAGEYRNWTASDLKRAKTEPWEAGILLRTAPTMALLEQLCAFLHADHGVAIQKLFISAEHEEHRVSLLIEVARSVILGPRQRIEPFHSLFLAGKLSSRKRLLDIFTPHLTEDILKQCGQGTFTRAARPSFDHPLLVTHYRQIGLTLREAEACAKVLAPPEIREKAPRLRRHRKRCLDLFIQALAQPDIHKGKLYSKDVIGKLSSFGLTTSRFYSARKGKFTARSLTNTAENQQQVRSMAKRLKLNPTPFLEALIDG